jgi:predicted phage terminase large subunit-like protein
MFDTQRLRSVPELRRVVVAVDPSGTKGDDNGDDIGIVVAAKGQDGRLYVLEDATCQESPDAWARRVSGCFQRWHGDRVVAEKNFGGAMVEAVLRTAAKNLPVKMVTASRGKIVRAEPVAALYEQQKVSHCGAFDALEDQLCEMTGAGYVGEGSPDRADALVWALTELAFGSDYCWDSV